MRRANAVPVGGGPNATRSGSPATLMRSPLSAALRDEARARPSAFAALSFRTFARSFPAPQRFRFSRVARTGAC